MRVRLSYYERVAGLFVLTAVVGTAIATLSAAINQGWFEEKVRFITYFENADGLHQGTKVLMAGIQAGAVEDVELSDDNRIRVRFHVLGKFRRKVKEDSASQLIRPFLIGERVLDISVGSPESKVLAETEVIPSQESVDLMTVLSGKKLGVYMGQAAQMLENLRTVLEAFLSKDRTETMVKIFDKLNPLVENMNVMSVEVTKLSRQATDQNQLKDVLQNVSVLTHELNKTLPQLSAALKEIGPEMPRSARRAVEALDEATVLIKALQKNMLLRGNVQEVRQEEKNRLPASK